ncbi:hypothetical protein NDU88_002843 [Pleurodeles waltl]|uniref:Uncharacterized protein n=1 Tax=Pleurodeles waltl TaxID=8319 RepID=A0AAV7M1T9_PLEWA|nr:hypothetical protein NDU88_002843 [Pleurodeles waltl]
MQYFVHEESFTSWSAGGLERNIDIEDELLDYDDGNESEAIDVVQQKGREDGLGVQKKSNRGRSFVFLQETVKRAVRSDCHGGGSRMTILAGNLPQSEERRQCLGMGGGVPQAERVVFTEKASVKDMGVQAGLADKDDSVNKDLTLEVGQENALRVFLCEEVFTDILWGGRVRIHKDERGGWSPSAAPDCAPAFLLEQATKGPAGRARGGRGDAKACTRLFPTSQRTPFLYSERGARLVNWAENPIKAIAPPRKRSGGQGRQRLRQERDEIANEGLPPPRVSRALRGRRQRGARRWNSGEEGTGILVAGSKQMERRKQRMRRCDEIMEKR